MALQFESGFRERLAEAVAAARSGDYARFMAVSRRVTDTSRVVPSIDGGELRRVAEQTIGEEEDLWRFWELVSSYLPTNLWGHTIYACGDSAAAVRARTCLESLGFTVDRTSPYAGYLERLGMLSVVIPPCMDLLSWIERVDVPGFLGDGNRPVTFPVPASVDGPAAGPAEAMQRCMLQGGGLPNGLDTIMDGAVRVAVVDSGIDASHPALAGRIEAQYDLSPGRVGPIDPDGHGTHVAGIIAGLPDRRFPAWHGIAPFARLLDIQVWDPLGTTTHLLLAGIGCAVEHGVDVLNLSMGTSEIPADATSLESRAIQAAVNHGVIACVAVGNDGEAGPGHVSVPSDARDALAVAAVDLEGRRALFSSLGPSADPEATGEKPNVAAPGVNIISPRSRYSHHDPYDEAGRYTVLSGTSMATPMVAGVCALGIAWARARGRLKVSGREIRDTLLQTADPVFGQRRNAVGHGVPCVGPFLCRLAEPFPQKTPQAPTEPATPKEGIAAMDPAVTSSALKHFLDEEAVFVRGVRANAESHGVAFAASAADFARSSFEALGDEDETHALQDEARLLGANHGMLEVLPRNAGCWTVLREKRLFGGGLYIGAKSLAGAQALELLGADSAFTARTLQKYLAGLPDRLARLSKVYKPGVSPVYLSLFAPHGWTEDMRRSAAPGRNMHLILCAPDPAKAGAWTRAETVSSWREWLCLTPMTLNDRVAYARAVLESHPHLRYANEAISFEEAQQALDLPLPVTVQLCTLAAEDGTFRVKPGSETTGFVQRMKVR